MTNVGLKTIDEISIQNPLFIIHAEMLCQISVRVTFELPLQVNVYLEFNHTSQ